MTQEEQRRRAVRKSAAAKLSLLQGETVGDISLTHEELQLLGEQAVKDANAFIESQLEGAVNTHPETLASFTCYKCEGAHKCPYVYDQYNLGGSDCLASK